MIEKLLTTKSLSFLIRGGDRYRSIYRWKKERFIHPAHAVEGKGRGKSDLWDLAGATWALCLDELFEIGLLTTSPVYLTRVSDAGQITHTALKLKESKLIQDYLEEQDYDVVVQLIRYYGASYEKHSSEVALSPSPIFLNRIAKANQSMDPIKTTDGANDIESIAIIWTRHKQRFASLRWWTAKDKELDSQ